jgi:hypothetical protein
MKCGKGGRVRGERGMRRGKGEGGEGNEEGEGERMIGDAGREEREREMGGGTL